MKEIAEKILASKKLADAVDSLMMLGIDDEVGAAMFSTADICLSLDGKKIEITLYPNDYYIENYERKYKHGVPQREKLD